MCDTYTADWSAIADRMQFVFETLTGDTYGATTVAVDYAAANRAIAYCRRVAAGAEEDESPDGPWAEMLDFLSRHNQCLDWVLCGDPAGMILTQAMNTSSRQRPRLRVVI
jgi:hypothetical protein